MYHSNMKSVVPIINDFAAVGRNTLIVINLLLENTFYLYTLYVYEDYTSPGKPLINSCDCAESVASPLINQKFAVLYLPCT